MSKLRPTLTSGSTKPCMDGGTAYLMILRAVKGEAMMTSSRSSNQMRAYIERLESALLDYHAAGRALDELVAPDPDKSLAQRIRDEFHDLQMLVDHCSEIYCHVTSSRISKPTTLPSEVIAVAEDLENERIAEAVAEAKQEWEDERFDWRERLGRIIDYSPCLGAKRVQNAVIALLDEFDALEKPPAVCQVPPPGWHCTRAAGHDGPCAALPEANTIPTNDRVARLIKMAKCLHTNRTGGNDYIFCQDCHLMWDYRRESANDMLVAMLATGDPSHD